LESLVENSEKKEIILLDAKLVEVIHNGAFRAVLFNGHTLVAYIPRESRNNLVGTLNIGDTVKVKMSPFDMNRGEVVIV
jgi:translation initiation factor IF-1